MADFNQSPSGQVTLVLALPQILLGLGASDPSVSVFLQNIDQSVNAGATLAAEMPGLQMALGSSDVTLDVYRISFFIPGTPTILFQLQTETPEPPQIPPTGQIYPRGYY
jgi:hypothetical protein